MKLCTPSCLSFNFSITEVIVFVYSLLIFSGKILYIFSDSAVSWHGILSIKSIKWSTSTKSTGRRELFDCEFWTIKESEYKDLFL